MDIKRRVCEGVVFEVRGILLQHIFFNEKQLNDKQEKLR
jgi:hypothetical protein